MRYGMYVFLIFITWPVRLLLFFYSKDRFYAHLLFGFRYKFYWAWCQVSLETRDMTSNLIENYNNVCGMGYNKNNRYQDGFLTGPDGGRTVATYKKRYRGWYDYYDLITNRYKGVNQGYFSKEPGGDPPRLLGFVTNQEAIDYMYGMSLVLYGYGFFTVNPNIYWEGIKAKMATYTGSHKWMYILTWVLEVVFMAIMVWFVRWVYRMIAGKKKSSVKYRESIFTRFKKRRRKVQFAY